MNIVDRPSPNQRAREPGAPIDMLVLHYTGMQSAQAAIDRLCDPEAAVSSHYVVDEDGAVVRLVDEARRAAHAGISFWRGVDGLNERSIGIEIVNPGHEWGYRPFPEGQIDAVTRLCRDIIARHPIPRRHVVAHSDIAPDRKQDPGELFPWRRLAASGIGIWPDVEPRAPAAAGFGAAGAEARLALARIGYRIAPDADPVICATVVTAFQRHWRPGRVDGRVDAETAGMIAAVDAAFRADASA